MVLVWETKQAWCIWGRQWRKRSYCRQVVEKSQQLSSHQRWLTVGTIASEDCQNNNISFQFLTFEKKFSESIIEHLFVRGQWQTHCILKSWENSRLRESCKLACTLWIQRNNFCYVLFQPRSTRNSWIFHMAWANTVQASTEKPGGL